MVERGSSGKRSWLFWVAVALPVLFYVGSIGLAEAKRRGAPQIEVKIEGYDPRDLLRGQYLQYRLSVAERGGAHSYFGFACAGPPAPRLREVYLHDGETAPGACEMELPADFVQDVHRFFIQQDRGRELEEAVRDGRASVSLRVVNPRYVMVEDLLVDGKPIR